jgi:linoleoyl-CoA desaturase
MSKVTFNNKQSPFFKALKQKVDTYFSTNQLHPSGNRQLLLKSVYLIASAITLYVILVFFTPGVVLSTLLCALLGLNLSVIGFNVMHEGGHQSFSKYKWLNNASAYSLNVLGANSYFWKIKHNVNHHTYTNVEGMDSDIDIKPFMRLHQSQPRFWVHRFQHVYWVLLYAISYAVWIFYEDFVKYFTGRIVAGGTAKKIDLKEHFIFWISKAGYIGVYIVLPIIMVGWVQTLVGFAIMISVCGLFISIVFQLAHIVEGTQFPLPNPDSHKIEQEWAIHQVSTTANFATRNKIVSWLLGGLNFQVEHHLFPKISHIHYPQINQFVKETCQEFNIAYVEYPSMLKAFYSHLQHIRKLGMA